MVFLSYPKYYRDAEEKLALVETDLVESTDPDWDYEVSKGIWQLKVKTDGTFQAQHEGDVFTYRFQNLGIGQGSEFRSVDLGEPDFSNFQIIGDTIRWSEVLPDIDLTVRYIHDILKVDVIVKRDFMNDLRAEVNSGGLSGEDYLTARFDIPSVFINSQAKQGGEDRDIYAEPIELTNAPLTFERDGKTLHKLRPVESYVLDENGEPIYWDTSNEPIIIRSSQRWQLQRNGGGFAEMSANLGDLANAPEGDVVIDPSETFEGEGFFGGGDIYDAFMDEENPNSKYGDYQYLSLGNTNGNEKRILLGVSHVTSKIPSGSIIHSAKLKLNVLTAPSNPGTIKAAAFKNTKSWYLSTVTWNDNGFNNPPSTSWSGGEYVNDYQGLPIVLPSSVGSIFFDLSMAFKSHYINAPFDLVDKGFLIKATDSTSDTWYFYSTDYASTSSLRPTLTVNYGFTQFGADVGNGNDQENYYIDGRQNNLAADKMSVIKYFDHGDSTVNPNDHDNNGAKLLSFVSKATSKGQKVIVNSGAAYAYKNSYSTEELGRIGYGNRIEKIMDTIHSYIPGTVVGIEIGNEEEGKWYDSTPPDPTNWYGDQDDGERFAEYYLEAFSKIQNHTSGKIPMIISGGTVEKHETIDWPLHSTFGSALEFMKGFINKVQQEGGNTNEKLPDTFSIHMYSYKYNPEFYSNTDHPNEPNYDPTYKRSLQHNRFDELFLLCKNEGLLEFIPNFLTTEHGISDRVNDYGPNNAVYVDEIDPDDTTQAIYFIRNSLIHATSSIDNKLGWMYSIYWQHPVNPNFYTSFFDDYNPADPHDYGDDRVIRYASRKLFDNSAILNLNDPYTRQWIPFKTELIGLPDEENAVKQAVCGWITDNLVNGEPERWATTWVFKEKLERYYKPSSTQHSFTIDGDYASNYNHKLYKFNFSLSPSNVFEEDATPGNLSVSHSGGITTVTIQNVTENPSFVRFIPN